MKTKLLSMVLTAMMIVTSATAMTQAADYDETYVSEPTGTYYQIFNDVPSNHWAFSYIGAMVQRGVLNGYPDGNFYPDNTVTRAEFAKIMIGAAKMPVYQPAYKYFQDVETTAWYAPYVHSAYPFLSGYDYGTNNRYYMPDEPAVREDIAVALVKLKGYEDDYADTSILSTMFTDVSSISLDARPYVAIAVERRLVSGYDDRTFRGQASITRAEAAAMLWRAYQYGNDNKVFDDEYYENGNSYYDDDDYNYGYGGSGTVRATPTPTKTLRPTPTLTPEPTRTPRPTATPTPKPTPTQDPTPTPEPPRPCEMDTIVKVNLPYEQSYSGWYPPYRNIGKYYITYDDYDNIYYYDSSDNKVYMIDMDSEDISPIIDVGELTMRDDGKFDYEIEDSPTPEAIEGDKDTTEESADEPEREINAEQEEEEEKPIEHYLDFNVDNIYYDKEKEMLLLRGEFKNITDWQRPGKKFDVDAPYISLDITNSDEPTLYTGETSTFKDWYPSVETNDSTYQIGRAKSFKYDLMRESTRYLFKYNYNHDRWDYVNDMELPSYSDYTLKDNIYYFWSTDEGNMFTCDLNGVVLDLDIQEIDDVYVMDKTVYPSHIDYFYVCDNGKFVFYDKDAEAIRVIRER